MINQQRRFYRSQTNKVIAGVCGGLGEYLNVDTTIIRLLWILLTIMGGSGIIVYILAYFIVPERPVSPETATAPNPSDFTAARIFGILFVAVGGIILLDNLDIFSFHRWWDLSWEFVFPGCLILLGIYFLTKRERIHPPPTAQAAPAPAGETPDPQQPSPVPAADERIKVKVLRRSLTDKKIGGICGGMGEYFEIDPTLVRVAFAIVTVLSGGMGLIIYFLMYLIVPEGQVQPTKQE
jgi:phage shock protein C